MLYFAEIMAEKVAAATAGDAAVNAGNADVNAGDADMEEGKKLFNLIKYVILILFFSISGS